MPWPTRRAARSKSKLLLPFMDTAQGIAVQQPPRICCKELLGMLWDLRAAVRPISATVTTNAPAAAAAATRSCWCCRPGSHRLTPCLRASYDTAIMLPLDSGKSRLSPGCRVRKSPY